jgi:hypothetical protein
MRGDFLRQAPRKFLQKRRARATTRTTSAQRRAPEARARARTNTRSITRTNASTSAANANENVSSRGAPSRRLALATCRSVPSSSSNNLSPHNRCCTQRTENIGGKTAMRLRHMLPRCSRRTKTNCRIATQPGRTAT